MLERPPFKRCPKCLTDDAFGILWVGGSSLTRRCKRCSHKLYYDLPNLKKKVIYLDQNAISNIFRISSQNSARSGSNDELWNKIIDLSRRTFLLQQIVFPLSDIHRDETLVYIHSESLNLAHEMLSGDVSFVDSEKIIISQTLDFLEKFLSGEPPPKIDFDIEEAIEGSKDTWMPDLHVTASMNMSVFADQIRSERDAIGPAYENLLRYWEEQRPSFQTALRTELDGYGTENKKALQAIAKELATAIERGDLDASMRATSKRLYKQFILLCDHIEQAGYSRKEAILKIFDFWSWEGNTQLPHNKISSYLFAALARRISSGQRKHPGVSIFNDFRVISTYAPYVDAMFLDNECANLLNEEPLKTELALSSKIFSAKSGDRFIAYLEQIEANTPGEVRAWASEIYDLN